MTNVLSCPHFPACNGCDSIGVDYEAQLEEKVRTVRTLFELARLTGFDPDSIRGITAGPNISHYRNRVRLVPARRVSTSSAAKTDDRVMLGLYRAGTHDVVDIPECPAQMDGINQAIEVLRAAVKRCEIRLYDEVAHSGDLRFVSVRRGAATGEVLIGLVTRSLQFFGGDRLAACLLEHCDGAVGVVQNINPVKGNVIFGRTNRTLAGSPFFGEIVCGVRLQLGLTSFFQVNTAVAEQAYDAIVANLELTEADTLLDLFAGVGAIGLVASPHVGRVVGVEQNKEAVELAAAARERNGVSNIEFLQGLVEDRLPTLPALLRDGTRSSGRIVAVVNPPRKGLECAVIRALADGRVARIAYLSCAPRTLIRDLARFLDFGFAVRHLELFDMFPQTEQVETLVILDQERTARG